MRSTHALSKLSICLAALLVVCACHSEKEFTQSFVNEKDSTQTLTLTSNGGVLRDGGFPHNVIVKIYGTDDLKGTYALKNGSETSNGTFVAGMDGDKQWIRFTPKGGTQKDWRVEVTAGRFLEGDGSRWEMQSTDVRAHAVSNFKIGE